MYERVRREKGVNLLNIDQKLQAQRAVFSCSNSSQLRESFSFGCKSPKVIRMKNFAKKSMTT